MSIGLISAVPFEGEIILKYLKRITTEVFEGLTCYRGRIWDKDIVYLASGIGKTNASHTVTILIEKFSPRLVINFGVGGAYPSSGLKIGDIAIAEKEIYGDEEKYFNEFPLDKILLKKFVKSFNLITRHGSAELAEASSLVTKMKPGPFVTVSTCTGTIKRALELEKRFNAICENMEGVAVAHICTLYGIPMVEIRGISNIVEDRDMSKWDLKLAAENCQMVVMEFLKEI
ncbi:MAG: futalosine hydrolase [Nitrospirae bacterium]|nr:futalosine hydrolase [Nitrospirota bacterium]